MAKATKKKVARKKAAAKTVRAKKVAPKDVPADPVGLVAEFDYSETKKTCCKYVLAGCPILTDKSPLVGNELYVSQRAIDIKNPPRRLRVTIQVMG